MIPSNKASSLHSCGHTVPQAAHSHPQTHLLPPTCLLLLHVIAAVSYIFFNSLLPQEIWAQSLYERDDSVVGLVHTSLNAPLPLQHAALVG